MTSTPYLHRFRPKIILSLQIIGAKGQKGELCERLSSVFKLQHYTVRNIWKLMLIGSFTFWPFVIYDRKKEYFIFILCGGLK